MFRWCSIRVYRQFVSVFYGTAVTQFRKYVDLFKRQFVDLVVRRRLPIVCFRYVNRVSAKLQSLLSDADKMTSLSRLMVTRREETRVAETELHPKLDLIRQKMKELKVQV